MAWLQKHRRFVFHFTPTSASWLNAIEGFFAKLTKKRLKHPNLHGWMERLYRTRGGKEDKFNCVNIQLTADDLQKLKADID